MNGRAHFLFQKAASRLSPVRGSPGVHAAAQCMSRVGLDNTRGFAPGHLMRLPINTLKIDKALAWAPGNEPNAVASYGQ
jgi:hypothetical protein